MAPASIWQQPQVVAALITAAATFLSAILVGVVGTFISRYFTKQRDKQDKESQWRSHALELTKLEVQRKLATHKPDELRPAVLDFLANYRDLQELGAKSPRELYETIQAKRIAQRPPPEGTLPPGPPSSGAA